MLRVITGSARGRKLKTLPGESVTRPTAESVKEALFSMIQFEINEKRVFDLFAGSGQLGIEALSRGASFCVFAERDRDALKIVRQNVAVCGFEKQSEIIFGDSVSLIKRESGFDIIFVDPPYDSDLGATLVDDCSKALNPGGILICETSSRTEMPRGGNNLALYKSKRYGKTKLTLYRKGIHENSDLSGKL